MSSSPSRRLFIVVALSFLLVAGFAAGAEAKFASLVVDAGSGATLHAVNADRQRHPASLTKIMTLYMLFDALDRGDVRLNQRLKVSTRASGQPPSKLGLRAGTSITVEDAILALVTKSANDVATVVAENLATSETAFARKMTAKARAIGMKHTRFMNASGLPHSKQVTTARDMAALAGAMLTRFSHYYHYFSTDRFYYGGRWYRNHNRLLGRYDGVDGIKTGYIRASGFNLVASAKRNGRRLIGVVLGARTSGERSLIMADLLDKGFATRGRGIQTVGAIPAPPVARWAGPAATPTGSWGIQVGAFGDRQSAGVEAEKARRVARRELPPTAAVDIGQSSTNGKTPLYLARIVGLDRDDADATCALLKQKRMVCMVVEAPSAALVVARETGIPAPSLPSPRPEVAGGTAIGAIGDADTSADNQPYGVQVGAFPAYNRALEHARQAKTKVPGMLDGGQIAVVPTANTGRRPLYRARIVGIDRQVAQDVCQALEAHAMSCMVVRM
jgi:D-alanyl-D-alanine carboxypeptidase